MTEEKNEKKSVPITQLKEIWQNRKHKQTPKRPTFTQKPIKKVTGRGR